MGIGHPKPCSGMIYNEFVFDGFEDEGAVGVGFWVVGGGWCGCGFFDWAAYRFVSDSHVVSHDAHILFNQT